MRSPMRKMLDVTAVVVVATLSLAAFLDRAHGH